MNERVHQYGQAVVAVILAALLSGVVGLFNRLEKIEDSIQHTDALEEKFSNIYWRLEQLEK